MKEGAASRNIPANYPHHTHNYDIVRAGAILTGLPLRYLAHPNHLFDSHL